ncbi:MAG: sulfurtransferase TusA family protein [Actinobacteria bacterium]|nr:sulfurtransferase TusA family protein [Actinomycetota bacterium]
MTADHADHVVDALGRACPIPVIELAKVVETAAIGDIVEVLSDDPASKVDVPVWCRMRGQRFLSQTERPDGGWAFRVTKLR